MIILLIICIRLIIESILILITVKRFARYRSQFPAGQRRDSPFAQLIGESILSGEGL